MNQLLSEIESAKANREKEIRVAESAAEKGKKKAEGDCS